MDSHLNTSPAFTVDQVTLQRRMRFNPLRMLDPEWLSMALDQFDIGILRHAMVLWDAMIRRDDTLSFVVPQFENSIAGKPWGVFKKKNADPVEAARHAAALEHFYSTVTAVNAFDRNERGDRHLLLKQMGSAFAFRYAVHHFVWKPTPGKMIEVEGAAPVPALSAEMEFVPAWYFENTTGTLRFLPFGGFGATGQEMDFDGEWMCTTGPGMMCAASICYTFKRLTFQDWTIFNERYAQHKVIGQTPDGKESPQGQAMAEMVASFNSDMGIVLYNSTPGDKPPISLLGPSGTVSVDLFERFLDRQDRKMTVMFRGSDLRNMSREKDVTGVSAQSDETEALEMAHCANIASACRTFIDRTVIRYCFGDNVEPLAYFGLPDMNEEDAEQLRENAGFLADRGALVELDTVAERLGVTLTEDPADALQPSGGRPPESDPISDDPDPDDEKPIATGNAKAARLEQLIREALRTQNGTWNEEQHPRGEAGRFIDGNVVLSGEEFGKNLTITKLRKAATAHLDSLRGKFVPNEDTKLPILIDRRGSREPVSGYREPVELQAVAGIEKMIAKAKHSGRYADTGGTPDITAWHEYTVPVRIGDARHEFVLKVREMKDGQRFYDSYRKKEGPAAKSGTTAGPLGGPKANTSPES